MAYQVLSLKWRPKAFNDVVGQEHITQALSNAIKLNRVAHAFTFSGPRGVGKTSTARILSKTLNEVDDLNDSLDIVEMDGASNRGIDEIRSLNDSVNYAPASGKYKIYIIDEVHMLTKEAFNALLKTLEEPPSHIVFILCTTELHKMPATILSRTQRFDFKRISESDIKKQLLYILDSEKINYEEDCLEIISEKSDGSMRDALSMLDQMICLGDNQLTLDVVKNAFGVVDDKIFFDLLKLIGLKDGLSMLKMINGILDNGVSLDDFINGFNKFLRVNFFEIEKNKTMDEVDLIRIMDLTLKFQSSIKHINQPKIAFEVLMLKLAHIDKSIDISKFLNSHNFNEKVQNKKKVINKGNKENISDLKQNDIIIKKSIKDKNDNIEQSDVNINQENKTNLSLDDIEQKWDKLLKKIGCKNSKTESFLADVSFDSFSNNKLAIKVNNVSEFIFKGLINDVNLMELSFYELFNVKIKINLFQGIVEKIDNKKNDKNKKDHPLFMDVLNKFDGEIIR